MDERIRTASMRSWFQKMGNLVDVSGLVLPEGVQSLEALFYWCNSLEKLPDGFSIPDSVTMADSLFQSCQKLSVLPEGFTISPDSSLTSINSMFRECHSLKTLPAGFTIPSTITSAVSLCSGCVGLVSLPEGFSVPASLKSMDDMFSECRSLTVLPAAFDFPLDVAEASRNPFYCRTMTETHFAGGAGSPSSVNRYTKWAEQNRAIVTAVPDGKAFVELMVPDKGTGAYKLWTRWLADAGEALAEPAACEREGFAFAGWYADEGLSNRFDFSQPVPAGGLKLYARYVENGGADRKSVV